MMKSDYTKIRHLITEDILDMETANIITSLLSELKKYDEDALKLYQLAGKGIKTKRMKLGDRIGTTYSPSCRVSIKEYPENFIIKFNKHAPMLIEKYQGAWLAHWIRNKDELKTQREWKDIMLQIGVDKL